MTPEQQPKQESTIAPPVANSSNLGLYSAVVKAIQSDAEGQFSVQVSVNDSEQADRWALLAQPYATSVAGMYFYPEVGDQVLIGFLGGATDSPVILGSLYGKNRAPAYTPDAKNSKKALVTASKLTLEFDDEQKTITLKTPAGNTLVISDAEGGNDFTLTDRHNNTITMSNQGVAIVSKSSLSLQADQAITIESMSGDIQLKAAHDIEMRSLNVSATASVELALKSATSAELSSDGVTTVKGPLVLIN